MTTVANKDGNILDFHFGIVTRQGDKHNNISGAACRGHCGYSSIIKVFEACFGKFNKDMYDKNCE